LPNSQFSTGRTDSAAAGRSWSADDGHPLTGSRGTTADDLPYGNKCSKLQE
jgi:hypothetical protein